MRVNRIPLLAASSIAVTIGCEPARNVDVQAEAAAIHALSRQWLEAINAQDLEASLEFYASDAIEMQPNAPAMTGLSAIRAWFETGLLQPTISNSFEADTIEVAASGDLAYERGSYHFAMETPSGPVEDQGKYVMIWKKIAGEWKVIVDISNSDRPLLQY